MRKRIAILVAQIDESTQKKFITEFIKQAYAYDYDVCIFTMYQKYQETPLRDIGDSNIFELVNFDLFEAIVVLSDTILTPGYIGPLHDRIKEKFKGPVLVVDKESSFFDSVMMDHYTPVKKIINHLIEDHGYRDIAFLGGKEGHPHSVQRLNAFLDSMREHDLTVREEWIYHGNYWYDSAEDFVDLLLEDREHLPRALACANDCMAIGAAARLTENGIRVPEDVAVTGYDSLEAGKDSPSPLTSADIPAGDCGEYCAHLIHSKIMGEPCKEFVSKAPLFIGGSCGCVREVELLPKKLRPQWRTQQSAKSMFSDFNHMLADLMDATSIKAFLKLVSDYAYQIMPFEGFAICLNEGFTKWDNFVGENALRKGYTDTMYEVFRCSGKELNKSIIDLEMKFNVKDLVPELHVKRDFPTTFIFNPLYFDDRCFGYVVINYGEEVELYDLGYRIWMKDIMQGMESFYRKGYMFALVEKMKADQIRDSLTGLYNYDGFIRQAAVVSESKDILGKMVNVITMDIQGMKQLNEIYGRHVGEKAIKELARIIQGSVRGDEICCRMCNDEFLITVLDDDNSTRANEIMNYVKTELKKFKLMADSDYELQIYAANLLGIPTQKGELEYLINQAISIKNHKKNAMSSETKDLMDEIKRNQLVMQILNQNLLTYHYQPIVSAKDGSIYAYEALMRYERERISPLQIIQSATYLNRLADIEKSTLLNVTKDVEENIDLFGNAKVFINSLPGIELSREDDAVFTSRSVKHTGRFVIEFTEEAELNDDSLKNLKDKYERIGNQVAIDDYGSGYSNVNNLLRYMPQYVKIDRMLITDIHINPQKQHLVKNIIEFAHDNDIIALAEGVETSEELQECIKLGIDLIQGYYTGKPMRTPIGEIAPEIRAEIEQFQLKSMDWSSMQESMMG